MKKVVILLLFLPQVAFCQIFTKEDSLSAGLKTSNANTVISGYGEAKINMDLTRGESQANITRNVIFLGHKFSDQISLFSELELENTKVENGNQGEFALEQLFLKININRNNYISTGLFLPRIGIINENHLPATFLGCDRNFVESLIIPSTWRELGVSLNGRSYNLPGLNYTLSLMNGLNASGYSQNDGIREARYEGSLARSQQIAVSASLLYYYRSLRMQVSAYYGGSNVPKTDSVLFSRNPFSLPVALIEANLQWTKSNFQTKLLIAHTRIIEAEKMNSYYHTDAPMSNIGAYIELSYNILSFLKPKATQRLLCFGRYEYLNQALNVSENTTRIAGNEWHVSSFGLQWYLLKNVCFKGDYKLIQRNQLQNQELLNIGMAFHF